MTSHDYTVNHSNRYVETRLKNEKYSLDVFKHLQVAINVTTTDDLLHPEEKVALIIELMRHLDTPSKSVFDANTEPILKKTERNSRV